MAQQPRKIIFSRKGFDTGAGGCPSPIFPDGTMLSLPIPASKDAVKFTDIKFAGYNPGRIVEDLTYGKRKRSSQYTCTDKCHLDPDLRPDALDRENGWLPSLGQISASLSHLNNQNVAEGDLFIFFGLFRKVEQTNDRWHYVIKAPNRHIIWGWLRVGEKLEIGDSYREIKKSYPWLAYHPHLHEHRRKKNKNNAIYIASPRLDLKNTNKDFPGGGAFQKLAENRILSASEQKKCSKWKVPAWLYPEKGKTPLTYHYKKNFEKLDSRYCYLNTVGRGQEFVLKTDEYPESLGWVERLFEKFEK